MTTKSWSGAPFGKQSTRFSVSGLHPNLLVNGHIPYEIKGQNLGPGSYEILPYAEFSEKNVTRKSEGPNWSQALYTEKMAKMPHLLFRDTYYKRKEYENQLGPGCYNIKDGLEMNDLKPTSKRGMLDAMSKRFPSENLNNQPGPGAYGIPDANIEAKKWEQGGKVPLFERSKESRSLPFVGTELGPGTYNHKNSIDELIKKQVSKRGPYDLFSINRSDAPKTGHYTNGTKWNLGPGQYEIPSFVEDMSNTTNKTRGKFSKLRQYPERSGERICIEHTALQPKDPDFPGPGDYSPGDQSKFTTNLPAFLSTTSRNDKRSHKFFMRNFNSVGVGRYDIQRFDESADKNGNTSVFLSKAPKVAKQKDEMFIKERLKPHNLSTQQKQNLYMTGNVNGRVITA